MTAMQDRLDNVTNNSSTSSQTIEKRHPRVNFETGEVMPSFDPVKKWVLQRVAGQILSVKTAHRVCKCYRYVRPDYLKGKQAIEVRGGIGKRPYYVGLMVCGRVWLCPVCSVKIQSVRALQVRAAIDAHIAQGGSVWMVTQTIPHTRFDNLQELVKQFSKAFHSFKSGMTWVSLKDAYKVSGYIKALEVTWSPQHGWHPHMHTIYFLDMPQKDVDTKAMHSDMFAQWERCANRNGFQNLSPNAFDIRDASRVKNYLNKMTGERYKWGSENELTKLHTKKARGNSFAPFDFLNAYNETANELYAKLFREFAIAFHGKMHLTWSKGLKVRYGVSNQTDEQVAQSIGEIDAVLALVSFDQWKSLCRLKDKRWRGELLDIVMSFGQEGLKNYLKAKGV